MTMHQSLNDVNRHKLQKIRPFLASLLPSSTAVYAPTQDLTLDEILSKFKGHDQFRQFLLLKRNHFGQKGFVRPTWQSCLCDLERQKERALVHSPRRYRYGPGGKESPVENRTKLSSTIVDSNVQCTHGRGWSRWSKDGNLLQVNERQYMVLQDVLLIHQNASHQSITLGQKLVQQHIDGHCLWHENMELTRDGILHNSHFNRTQFHYSMETKMHIQ